MGGLIQLTKRKECRRPTWQGWIVISGCLLVAAFLFVRFINGFLAISRPIHGEILVVEGWLDDEAIKASVELFKSGTYQWIVTTGGPLEKGNYLAAYHDYAELAAATIRKLGVEPGKIVAAPAPPVDRDRTFEAALALKRRLERFEETIHSLDVVTEGTHARRTRYLYQKACGSHYRVGVIAQPSPDYDPRAWWRYSEGVKAVFFECLANVYVRVAY